MEVHYGSKTELKKVNERQKEVKEVQSNMKKPTPTPMSEEMFYHSFVKG